MSFCPHCHSGNDPVLKDTTWSCGVRFNDPTWRTKECCRRHLESANARIKRLEEAGDAIFLLAKKHAPEYWLYTQTAFNNWRKAKEDKL